MYWYGYWQGNPLAAWRSNGGKKQKKNGGYVQHPRYAEEVYRARVAAVGGAKEIFSQLQCKEV